MKFQNLIKLVTRNTAILSIVFAFVLGLVGMTGLRSKMMNTSNWFMSEEEVAEKFGDDDEEQGDHPGDGQDGNQQGEDNPGSTDEQNNQASNQTGLSSGSDDLGKGYSDASSSNQTEDAESDISSQTDLPTDSDGSLISDASGSEETLDSDNLTQNGMDSDMTSSTKLPSETTKTTKATKTSSTTRQTETQAPADSTTTTEAPTTAATTTQAPETTATEAPTTTTTVETTTEATTQKSSGSLGDTSGSYDNGMARQILDRVNAERAANGRSPLSWSDTLASDAAIRATELPVKWSHTRPDGSAWYTAGSGSSYGENLAKGQSSVDQAMADWMNSEGHRNNILDSDFTRMGVACYYCNGTYYWVQEFG